MATDIYHIKGGIRGKKAVAFHDGAAEVILIDTFAQGRVAANDTTGTFTAWVNVPDITGVYNIVGCGQSAAVEYFYISVDAGKIHYKAAVAGPDINCDIITGVVLSPHQWHHVAFVQSANAGGPPKIYVDGVEKTVTETNITECEAWFDLWANINGGHLGAEDSVAGGALLTNTFKGGLGNVKYWNRALSAAEVADDIKGLALTGDATYLKANWDFDNDYVNAANPGTYDGTAESTVVLTNNYSEFSSRFMFSGVTPLATDGIALSVENETGYAIIIDAA
jgi:hypothetical protein